MRLLETPVISSLTMECRRSRSQPDGRTHLVQAGFGRGTYGVAIDMDFSSKVVPSYLYS